MTATTTADTTPPSDPGGLIVGEITASTVFLSWNSGTDQFNPVSHQILVNGVPTPNALSTVVAGQNPRSAVQGAWVRATVPGQSGTGGFMSLRSHTALQLVGFSTPVAGAAELHEMAMDGNVMRMRPVDGLELPAGQSVELKPGGHHLMLMALKRPLTAGSSVPLVLRFKAPDGKLLEQKMAVPVRAAAPTGTSALPAHDHAH